MFEAGELIWQIMFGEDAGRCPTNPGLERFLKSWATGTSKQRGGDVMEDSQDHAWEYWLSPSFGVSGLGLL